MWLLRWGNLMKLRENCREQKKRNSYSLTGSVSLMSRGMALSQAPKDRIILRLPYWDFAYIRSTGGIRFEK